MKIWLYTALVGYLLGNQLYTVLVGYLLGNRVCTVLVGYLLGNQVWLVSCRLMLTCHIHYTQFYVRQEIRLYEVLHPYSLDPEETNFNIIFFILYMHQNLF